MKKFKKILYFLSNHERKHAALLLILILIMAILDMIGVASIMPFMTVLINPAIIETNLILNNFFQASKLVGIENNYQFIFMLGILIFILLIFSIIFKAFTTYIQFNFIIMREFSICKRLVEGYLHQPYGWFLNRHSADLGKTILSEVSQVVSGGIKSLIELIANSVTAIALISLLIFANYKLALLVGLSMSGFYGLMYFFSKNYLSRIGDKRLKNNQVRFTSISDSFGAIKEIKVRGLEKIFTNIFSKSAKIYARTESLAKIFSLLPRFILESIAFGGVLLIILFMMKESDSINNVIPIISLYVFAGYRLLPALQKVYLSLSQLAFVEPSINKLHEDLRNLKISNISNDSSIISLKKKIDLKNLFYYYPNSSRPVLKNINLTISAKSIIGIIGSSGSGKTTLVDIILGLIVAQKGTLEIDGEVITEKNSKSWCQSIGYVPQQIYLMDDTIAANIAFGSNLKEINQERLESSAKIANLDNFIKNDLPKQYQTTIGERGIRLSGGQRQRIGIARALYHNPQLLILDEATSAVDNETEKKIMDTIYNISENITIIMIAHRLSTLSKCDKIYLLDEGKLVREGCYKELIKDRLI